MIDFLIHVDDHLRQMVLAYGVWIYPVLFAIIFAETGLVVTPFLPGDSLLFAAGALAALEPDHLNVWLLVAVLSVAAMAGDSANYWIGRWLSPRIFRGERIRFLNQEHLDRTHGFYEKYGAKTIVLARFVPVVRTFAPFVAGLGTMTYRRFMTFNVAGGILWILVGVLSGFVFGRLPVVQDNFSLVILAIVVVSFLPMLYEFLRHRREIG